MLGDTIEVAELDGEPIVAVGAWAASGGDDHGAVFVLDGVPDGVVDVNDSPSVWGDSPIALFGVDLALAELGGDGLELAILDPGRDYGDGRRVDGGIYVYPLPLAGRSGKADAARRLASPPWYGNQLVAWEADGDGVLDLVVDENGVLALYAGPWTADRVPDDATARWTAVGNGSALEDVGDLDGDGLAELAFGAHTEPEPDRYGAVWLLPGGATGGGAVDGLDRITGDFPKMALGTDVDAGDLDGDGVPELLVGAAGLGPETGGRVLAFAPGGVQAASDAVGFVHGDGAWDGLGWAVLAVDPDGDGVSDVISCEDDAAAAICWRVPGAAF
jgi:hypothetical protein